MLGRIGLVTIFDIVRKIPLIAFFSNYVVFHVKVTYVPYAATYLGDSSRGTELIRGDVAGQHYQ